MNIENIREELEKINQSIKILFSNCNYYEDENLYYINVKNDIEDIFLKEYFEKRFYQLEKFVDDMEYINRPVRAEGYLYKNVSGRYAFNNEQYLTSGSIIEFLKVDEDGNTSWVIDRVENNGKDYYLYNCKSSLDGIYARKR